MSKDGTGLSVEPARLVTTLFALLPVPVAVVDENDKILMANSYFTEVFPGCETIRGARLHEIVIPGRGTFDFDVMPLNDEGYRVVYGTEVTKEVCLRRQLTQMERSDRASRAYQDRVRCDLNEIVRSIVRAREPYTSATRIMMSLELDNHLPQVMGDSEDLARVVTGLVTNAEQAIIFAHRRSGAINIKTWQENDHVRMSVCDNGCGISTRDIYASSIEPLIHDGSQVRAISVGLCAEVIKDHGGDLFCWSSYDAGSTYTLELPTVHVSGGRATSRNATDSRRLSGRSILVIDDDAHVTELLFDVLSRNGATVFLAESERQALPLLQSRIFDVIVCDENLPGLAADRFRTVVESLAPNGFQRFLFVTAESVNAQTRRFFAQAGVDFIRRPFHVPDLMAMLEMLLSQTQPQGF